MHHVGILYDQFMMHGQRNIKLMEVCLVVAYMKRAVVERNFDLNTCLFYAENA